MSLRNTKQSYGSISKGFHWGVGLLVLIVLGIGLVMTLLMEPSPDMFALYKWHKQLGIVVLAFVVLRLLWRFTEVRPDSLQQGVLDKIARFVHLLLYVCILALPLSGWAMSSAKGYDVNLFGVYTLPNFVSKNKELGDFLGDMHFYVGYTLLASFLLHFAGALKHAFIDKDDTLKRMLPFCSKGNK